MLPQWSVAGAHDFKQLICWQLADELRTETLKITAGHGFATNVKHRAQMEDAIDSVCRNMAKGLKGYA